MHGIVHLAKLHNYNNVSVVIIIHDVLKVALVVLSHRMAYSSFLHFGAHECVHYP